MEVREERGTRRHPGDRARRSHRFRHVRGARGEAVRAPRRRRDAPGHRHGGEVEYISSAGLRVLLSVAKKLRGRGRSPCAPWPALGPPGLRARGLPGALHDRGLAGAGRRQDGERRVGTLRLLHLRVTPPQGPPFDHECSGSSLVVGRSRKADLSIADQFLSRLHARFLPRRGRLVPGEPRLPQPDAAERPSRRRAVRASPRGTSEPGRDPDLDRAAGPAEAAPDPACSGPPRR